MNVGGEASLFGRGLAVGVGASQLTVGVVVTMTVTRMVEGSFVVPVRWVAWMLAVVGAWGCLRGRRWWAGAPLAVVILLMAWGSLVGAEALRVPSVGGVAVSSVVLLAALASVGVVVAGWGHERRGRGDEMVVASLGIVAGVVVDPMLVAMVALGAAVVAAAWRPVWLVAASILMVTVALWLGLIWVAEGMPGSPPPFIWIGALAAAFGLGFGWSCRGGRVVGGG